MTTRTSTTTRPANEVPATGGTHAAGHDGDGPEATTFHNGTRGRFNAWFFTAFDRYINLIARRHKERAFGDIGAGTIVELGAGVGANFAQLPPGSRLLAVEPNEAMHQQLLEQAAARGIDLRLIAASAEDLPIPDGSVDDVICSLVLCTVEDPARVVAEAHRVLRPGGTFRFVEHVAAHPATPRGWTQWVLAKPWAWVYEGCRLRRDTGTLIENGGFGRVEIERHRFRRSLFFPVNVAISGTATKGATVA